MDELENVEEQATAAAARPDCNEEHNADPVNEHGEQVLPLKEISESFGSLRLVNPRAEKQMQESLARYGQMSPVVVSLGELDRPGAFVKERRLDHAADVRQRKLNYAMRYGSGSRKLAEEPHADRLSVSKNDNCASK